MLSVNIGGAYECDSQMLYTEVFEVGLYTLNMQFTNYSVPDITGSMP